MEGGTKNFKNTSSSMQIFLLPMLLSVLRRLYTLSCINKLYLHLPNILGLSMLECYLETKAFSPFLNLKLNQTSDDLDYEQSLFFLGPLSKTPEKSK